MFVNNDTTINLVNQARQGDKKSLAELSELAITPLHRHVYRIVLKEDLAQDIVQEAMLEMCQIIGKLRDPSCFWPWLCGIAFNKIRHQKRSLMRHKTVSLSEVDGPTDGQNNNDGLAAAITDELQLAVTKAISKLKPEHRAVLSMRCYEKMEYPAIAESLESNTFAVRMLFFRAKKSLAKQLSRTGYTGLSIAIALTIFGKLTASSQAAAAGISVSSQSLLVGSTITTAGILSGKIAILLYIALAALYCTNTFKSSVTNTPVSNTSYKQINNVFLPQLQLIKNMNIPVQNWYYFPQGPDNIVMRQQIAVDPDNHVSHCLLLQNHQGCFYHPFSSNNIYLQNYNYFHPDLSVMQLPTDSATFTSHLNNVQGWSESQIQCLAKDKGLLIITQKDSTDKTKLLRHSNLLGEDYFKCDWPSNSNFIDKRDNLHKQGFAFFKIKGNINNYNVSGIGQIPLNTANYIQYQPRFHLRIGSLITISDNSTCAIIRKAGKKDIYYPGQSFFCGLVRPWSGLHSIDTIRRDAIKAKLDFSIVLFDNKKEVMIIVSDDTNNQLKYIIDLYHDLVKEITFACNAGSGNIKFDYFSEMDILSLSKLKFKTPAYYNSNKKPKINWLLDLPVDINN